MSLPALARIKEAFSDSEIIVASPQKLSSLWNLVPYVDSFETLPEKCSIFKHAQVLGKYKKATGLLFTNSFKSALTFWLARIKLRIGYKQDGRHIFLTHPVEIPSAVKPPKKLSPAKIRIANEDPTIQWPKAEVPQAHHVYYYLFLAGFLGAKVKMCQPEWKLNLHQLQTTLAGLNLPNPLDDPLPWIVIHPGAAYGDAKRWNIERFFEMALKVHTKCPARWFIIGGPTELNYTRQLATKLGQSLTIRPKEPGIIKTQELVFHLGGKTDIRELAFILYVADLFIGHDSGPMHLAAALGTPVIALYGSSSPEWTGPHIWNQNIHKVIKGEAPCAPCFLRQCPLEIHRCMINISTVEVVYAVLESIQKLRKKRLSLEG